MKPRMKRTVRFMAAVGTLAVVATPVAAARATGGADQSVSLMTYNVHGLPWPIVEDRSDALSAIAAQLRAMRAAGRQPGIVAVQEAFVPDAKAIGTAAGYRYAAFGADSDAVAQPGTEEDRRFVAAGSMMRGERIGKHVGSGLAIFSDYPILAVRRVSYPVCAGYDCLANKGAMAALIAVPGARGPVTVIDTHLNSNAATGVSEPRALYAYKRQIAMLGAFMGSVGRGSGTMLVAGDFNVGQDPARRRYFANAMFGGPLPMAAGAQRCRATPTCRVTQTADVATSLGRAKDWLMYRAANGVAVRPVALSAPFGMAEGHPMLSDHVGVMVRYALDRQGPALLAAPMVASR